MMDIGWRQVGVNRTKKTHRHSMHEKKANSENHWGKSDLKTTRGKKPKKHKVIPKCIKMHTEIRINKSSMGPEPKQNSIQKRPQMPTEQNTLLRLPRLSTVLPSHLTFSSLLAATSDMLKKQVKNFLVNETNYELV